MSNPKPRKSTKKTPAKSAKKPRRKRAIAPQRRVGPGRPTILSAAVTAKMVESIRGSGISVTAAAELHGIVASTVRTWMQAATPEHAEFQTQIRGAKRMWEYQLALIVRKAADDDAELALRVLAKRCSEDWGDRQTVEVIEPPAPASADERHLVELLRHSPELRRTYAAYLDAVEAAQREREA